MEIKLHEIKVRDIFNGYKDDQEDGVVGYSGKLDIRPPFQREFIYNEKERNAVIDTVSKGFPLNVMYWSKDGDNYQLLDGQQRTVSLMQYINGDYSVNMRFFHSLTIDEQNQILDYPLTIYICEGTDREKLDWFKVINIAGEKLTDQELRNAMYTGTWLYDAKRHFSKSNCPAYQMGDKLINANTLRQELLETALKWLCDKEEISIEEYMSAHQHDKDANELWQYYQQVINWINQIFPTTRSIMKGLDWGIFYNKYKNNSYNSNELEAEIQKLLLDDEVTKKSGIYNYLLSGEEKHLNLRTFSESMKMEAYSRQDGICPICQKQFDYKDMEGDHIIPWSKGGKTDIDNLQMLCKKCNATKSNK